MDLSTEVEPLPDDDERLAEAVAQSDVHALLAAVATIGGDLSILRDDLQVDPMLLMQPGAGVSDDLQSEGRRIALDRLRQWRDDGCPAGPPLDDDRLAAIVGWLAGGAPMADYMGIAREELAIDGGDARAPEWSVSEMDPERRLRVAVVGAGMSGLAAAHRLRQVGAEVVVFEKNGEVGGTWFDNSYPGCRVDVPNHFYSYSFLQSHDWPHHFSTRDTLRDYFVSASHRLELRDLIRFETEVTSMAWSDDAGWEVCVRRADGTEEMDRFDAVISAVGQLNRPKMPDIAGMASFDGPSFHTARWDHDVDLAGKRVVVIGTGASAMQVIPEIAPICGRLSVLQRTPAWLIHTPQYHEPVAEGQRWLFRHVPTYSQWYRFWLFWRMADGMLPATAVDDDWDGSERAVGQVNEMLRWILTQYLEEQFGDDPDLLAKVTPDYPPAAKRVIRDNGVWARTLKRPNVDLVTEGIDRIDASGVVLADGSRIDADVIIYGTGFEASRFLMPMKVTGRGGVDLHETWDGDARAYLGITVPGFPNLFCLYGPNTNIVINGSIIYFTECELTYVIDLLREMVATGVAGFDVRPDAHEAYNQWIDDGNRRRAWGVSAVSSWYKNSKGRSTQNWPFTLLEYWQKTRSFDPGPYEAIRRPAKTTSERES